MAKYIKVKDLQDFCDNQKDHTITPNDFQRMTQYDFGYHTGTPTEEGWYLCWVSFTKETAPMVYKWKNGKFMLTDTWESDDDILMWRKIESYKEATE